MRTEDEYGRPIYLQSEIPTYPQPKLAYWRGRVVESGKSKPGNVITGCHNKIPYAKCENGWVASGEWWLHCGTCRPHQTMLERIIPKNWYPIWHTDILKQLSNHT